MWCIMNWALLQNVYEGNGPDWELVDPPAAVAVSSSDDDSSEDDTKPAAVAEPPQPEQPPAAAEGAEVQIKVEPLEASASGEQQQSPQAVEQRMPQAVAAGHGATGLTSPRVDRKGMSMETRLAAAAINAVAVRKGKQVVQEVRV